MPDVPPKNWGRDSLTEFIEQSNRNRWATFANKPQPIAVLVDIDECFLRLKDLENPRDWFAVLLAFRSHSAFRGAASHAMAGHVSEIYPSVRVCLEYAAYALHINRHPELGEIWLRRHDDESSLKAVKNKFKIGDIRETILESDTKTAEVFQILYQRAIDFGAHPNERAVTGNLQIIELGKETKFLQTYLHGDGITLDHSLKTTALTGVCALDILEKVFAEQFIDLGITQRLEILKQQL